MRLNTHSSIISTHPQTLRSLCIYCFFSFPRLGRSSFFCSRHLFTTQPQYGPKERHGWVMPCTRGIDEKHTLYWDTLEGKLPAYLYQTRHEDRQIMFTGWDFCLIAFTISFLFQIDIVF